MRAPALVLLLSLSLVGVSAALALAGWHLPTAAAAPILETPAEAFAPRFVSAADGWLPAGADDPRPAFRAGRASEAAEVYDLYPGKDAIPVLDNPLLAAADEVDWLADQAPVLGLKLGTESRCYPLAILNWHCLVTDRVGGQTIYVFWDPPSGLGVARRALSRTRPMGLPGYGYRGVGLTYNPATGLLYDMLTGEYVDATARVRGGFGSGDTAWLPLERMNWREWRRLHPSTRVLSRDTGYHFDYAFDPYTAAAVGPQGRAEDYWRSETVLAPESLRDSSRTLPDKSPVLGFFSGTEPWAVPLAALSSAATRELMLDTAAGEVVVHAMPAQDRYYATDEQGRLLPQVRMFWFAWRAHFPATKVHPSLDS